MDYLSGLLFSHYTVCGNTIAVKSSLYFLLIYFLVEVIVIKLYYYYQFQSSVYISVFVYMEAFEITSNICLTFVFEINHEK